MIDASGAREGAARYATVPENRYGGRVIDCFGARRIAIRKEITRTNWKGFGRGKSTPLVISSLEIPTPVDKRGNESELLLPRVEVGHRGSNGKRHLAVTLTRYGLILGCSHPKKDDYTLMRQTPQQEEAQDLCRSTFWLRLVARRKLLAALLLRWTCANAPRPHDER